MMIRGEGWVAKALYLDKMQLDSTDCTRLRSHLLDISPHSRAWDLKLCVLTSPTPFWYTSPAICQWVGLHFPPAAIPSRVCA